MSGAVYAREGQVLRRKTRTQAVQQQIAQRRRGTSGMAAYILHLQRTIGNQAVGQWLRQHGAQSPRALQIPIQRALDSHGTDYIGPKGKKDIYRDADDGKFYFKSATSTAAVWQMIEVTLGENNTYAVPDADKKRAYNPATKAWLKPGEAAPAERPTAPSGWSLQEVRAARFAQKAANHYQKDYPRYKGYDVHVSAYKERDGIFTSFHVKFDTGDEHLSYFYNFNGSKHPGQNQQDQLRIIQNFIRRFTRVSGESTVGPLTEGQQGNLEDDARAERLDLIAEADAIARDVGLP